MPEMNYDYEYLATITKAIQELAEARAYDWHMFWLGVFGIIVSGAIAGLAARYAYKLNEEQKKIAEKQKDISEEQNKISLFEKRYALYSILKQLRWLGAKQKLIFNNNYIMQEKNEELKKMYMWRNMLATILVFTDAPTLNQEIEAKFHKKYLSTEIVKQKLSELENPIEKLYDLNIVEERKRKEYRHYVRLLHIEMLKAMDKIEQMHLLFTLNKENTNSLVDISEGFEQTHKDLYDEKISPDTYLEKMIAFCAQLEKVNCFEEMINEMEIIKK